MNTFFNLKTSALVAALLLASVAQANTISKDEYKAGKTRISADYKTDKAACASMSGNAKDVCIEEAKGHEKVAKAELDAQYKPSPRHDNDVRMAKAKAAYNVAKEKCDDKTGNDKDVCKKEAKASYTSSKGNAKVADAKEKSVADAGTVQTSKVADAKADAAKDKRDAAYAVAKEKCDAMKGDAKDACIKNAKVKYGQS